jgi:hypothetical protein
MVEDVAHRAGADLALGQVRREPVEREVDGDDAADLVFGRKRRGDGEADQPRAAKTSGSVM